MRLIKAFKEKPFHGTVAAVGIFLLVPIIQLFITPLAFQIWYQTLLDRPLNTVLYIIFSVSFGFVVPLYLYTRNKCIDCKPGDAEYGFGGGILGFALGVCPACFSVIGVVLPLSGSILLTQYSSALTSLAITIMFLSIYKMGGFKRL